MKWVSLLLTVPSEDDIHPALVRDDVGDALQAAGFRDLEIDVTNVVFANPGPKSSTEEADKAMALRTVKHHGAPGPAEGLPDDLAAVLRDQSIIVPQDAAVWELLASWRNAPAATASADVPEPNVLPPTGPQASEDSRGA